MPNHPILLYRGGEFDANFYHYSNLDIDNGILLVDGNKKTLFISKMNETFAKKWFDGKVVVYKETKELAKHIKSKKLFFDSKSMTVRIHKRLSKLFKLEDASEQLALARVKKTSDEVSKIRRAVSLSKKIFGELDFSNFKTESDVRKFLLVRTLELGLEPAFQPIVASGRNASMPHYSEFNSKLSDLVLVDYGVRYKHYNADLTRCFFLKKDNKKEQAYESVKQVFNELVDNFQNFKTAKQFAEFGAKQMKKQGLPEMIHSFGHGIGLDVHEKPRLSVFSKDKLLPKTAMAIEPAAYFKDFGVRYEETVYFDGKKARIL
ncbi:MAG: M24 family metallopeptidase [Candidatus Micrarchaeota archaeon]